MLSLADPVYRIEHVALLLGGSVDRAREYTYLDGFPAARKPGSRLLWLQADVVAWLAGQPKVTRADRRRTPRRAARHGARPPSVPRPEGGSLMTASTRATTGATRNAPVAQVEGVSVLAPTSPDGPYRFTWRGTDGKRKNTVRNGLDLDGAKGMATRIAASLVVYGAAKGHTPLGDVIDVYLSSPVGRNQKQQGEDWGDSQLVQVTRRMRTAFDGRPEREVLCRDVDRALLDVARGRSGTPNTRRELATNLRGFLRWGYTKQFFTPEQAELLPTNLMDIEGDVVGTAAPKRRSRVRRNGAAPSYISEEDAPSVAQVLALAGQFELAFPAWGRLDVELAAACGARGWGLSVSRSGEIQVSAIIPTVTGLLRHGTGFHQHLFKACAIEAGWPYQQWEQIYQRHDKATGERRVVTRTVTTFGITWHSLRLALLAPQSTSSSSRRLS